MIIDAHAHVSPTSYGTAENYVEKLKKDGIQHGVISPGGMLDIRKMNDYVTGKIEANPVPRNDYVDQAVEINPELYGFVCVDPRNPEAPAVVERYLKKGFRGLMVSPVVHRFSFLDEAMAQLASLCASYQAPICSHIAFRSGANTAEYVQLARQFPKTNFILEHMGTPPVDPDASAAAAELDNFFLETSLGAFMHILVTVKSAGASKVIFGSEYPLSHPAAELQKILLLPISDREREMILGDNARELYRLGNT